MKYLVIFYSESGNTEQVARAIAGALGVEARRIDTIKPEDLVSYDLICIGTPVQGARPAKSVLKFIEAMPHLPGKRVAIFCTMHLFGSKKVVKSARLLFEEKGLVFLGGFCCKGWSRLVANFGPRMFNRGRPSAKDLKMAEEFGRGLLASSLK